MGSNLQSIVLYLTVCIAIFSFGLSLHSSGHRNVEACPSVNSMKRFQQEESQFLTTDQEINRLKAVYQSLVQTLISYSVMTEQNRRYHLSSGLTEVRSYNSGTQPYHNSFTAGRSPMSIHDHANYLLTMGMGELTAVLNGVEFATRHNDYRLVQSDTSATYHAVKQIQFPEVPPSVTAQATVQAQIDEMKMYFRAWKTQNSTLRDYKPYFKPVMCYLEGAWISDSTSLLEPFASERHFIDAATWKSLNDKNRFLFASGRKNNLENLPFLPSILHDIFIKENYVLQTPAVKTLVPFLKYDDDPTASARLATTTVNVANAATLILVQTAKGLFLQMTFGKLGSLTAGGVTVNITCNPLNNTGCKTANAIACQGDAKRCRTFVDGSLSNMVFTWTAATTTSTHPLLSYGPLVGPCFSFQISFASATGLDAGVITRINGKENYTSTIDKPITIEGCVDDPLPLTANYEYRILCSPLNRDLPTNRFRVVDDTTAQMYTNPPLNIQNLEDNRLAYFTLNPFDRDTFVDTTVGSPELLDQFFEQIPGKDNAGCNLNDTVDGVTAMNFNTSKGVLNVCYYSRFYSTEANDAMGRQNRRRGFNDPHLWAAMTTQQKVAPVEVADQITGELVRQRWSYAIPLEIIYTTPLAKWNPYDLSLTTNTGSADFAAITAGGRNGGFTPEKAYNGTSTELYFYLTPAAFFGNSSGGDAADTSGDTVGVLDKDGVTVRKMRASGHYILFPEIAGVSNKLRQRYPIAPFASDKNPGYMNARALKHLLATKQNQLLDSKLNIGTANLPLWTSPSTKGNRHFHRCNIAGSAVDRWDTGAANRTVVVSEQEDGHTHEITIGRTNNPAGGYFYTLIDCDGLGPVCGDGHFKMCLTDQSCT